MTGTIHQIKNGFVNLYLIDEPNQLTLVDTGMPGSGPKAVLQAIRKLGRAPQDLKRILITHADLDHTGGALAVRTATGAQLCASAIEAPAIMIGGLSREPRAGPVAKAIFTVVGRVFKIQPVPVDQILEPGSEIPVLGGLIVIATPGHTPGHLSFYAPATGDLIAGDSMVALGGTLRWRETAVQWNYKQGRASVAAQSALGARTVYCGHGPVLTTPAFPV